MNIGCALEALLKLANLHIIMIGSKSMLPVASGCKKRTNRSKNK